MREATVKHDWNEAEKEQQIYFHEFEYFKQPSVYQDLCT